MGTAAARVDYAMGWLFSPSGMAFLTSAFSVLMMAFSEFRFVRLYFFAPLACAVVATYFFGSFALPCLLGSLNCLPVMTSASSTQAAQGEITESNADDEPRTPLSPAKDLPEVAEV